MERERVDYYGARTQMPSRIVPIPATQGVSGGSFPSSVQSEYAVLGKPKRIVEPPYITQINRATFIGSDPTGIPLPVKPVGSAFRVDYANALTEGGSVPVYQHGLGLRPGSRLTQSSPADEGSVAERLRGYKIVPDVPLPFRYKETSGVRWEDLVLGK